jgi:glutathione synthase/RimK-type ligase-like ATP-grasp enzyme
MKFLIPTEPDDTHAIVVKIALENIGHHVRLLFTADQPTKQRNSVFIENDSYQWKSSDDYDSFMDNDYDVVWWRRARKPFLPQNKTHPEDYKFVIRENALFFESLTSNMAPKAWWINTKEAANRANFKLLQLKFASQYGMNIPITLFSNDPMDIRYFLLKHDTEGVIYKPICSNVWFEEKHVKIVYTSKISFLDLPNNRLLQLVPGIFQKQIKKKYELRVTCFGDYLVAAKLNSQIHSAGDIDWRAIPEREMSIEPYSLPQELENKIRMFMNKMGIVFGSLDFIVTPDDNYIFLEVNEQGQFLWIEEYNPEIKMLDMFINFLLSKSRKFSWDTRQLTHTIEQYRHQIPGILTKNMQRHIDLNSAKTFIPFRNEF